jgi:GT2 family glycosyltransferase
MTTIRHALSEVSKLRRRKSDRSVLSIAAVELFERRQTVAFEHEPRVSIIICNRDGLRHLPLLCDALTAQSYTNVEIVFVDNASTDGSPDYFAQRFPAAKLLRLNRNHGFAAANNLGYLAAVGELVAFLNNDTVPQENWLSALVSELRTRPRAACAVPKLLFNRFFSKLTIRCSEQASLSAASLLRSLEYPKAFVDSEELSSESDIVINGQLTLVLPEQKDPIVLEFRSSADLARVSVLRDQRPLAAGYTSPNAGLQLAITNSWSNVAHWYRVINNAGSVSRQIFATADRGYGEIDAGQYDRTMAVDYLCGCAALVRRSALANELPFREEFFAYFEDSELSLRIRRRGLQIVYVPRSVVLHTHSATANADSTFRSYLIRRNRLIFVYHRAPTCLRRVLLMQAVLRSHHTAGRTTSLRQARQAVALHWLTRDPRRLAAECNDEALRDALLLIADSSAPIVPRKRVCLYNDYWNTCGGGEAHALEFARYVMSKGMELTLASKDSIDVARLSRLFSIDLRDALLLSKPDFSSADTQQFDLFINSTYQSTMVSRAKHSIFIVSFPSRNSSRGFRQSYFFAFNSDFTRDWSSRLWGPTRGMVIQPVVREITTSASLSAKSNVVLNVGRFSNRGHSKNQHVILRAFIAAQKANPLADWHLVLAGTLDQTNRVDVDYFGELLRASSGFPVSLVEGADRQEISTLYAKAKVYVHAAGLGVDCEKHPESTEHFGMTVAEAISAGCFVIVHDSGNPPFLVRRCGFGATYRSENELIERLAAVIGTSDSVNGQPATPPGENSFTPEVFAQKLTAALQAMSFET